LVLSAWTTFQKKLSRLGIEIGNEISASASNLKEILELGIPFIIMLTINDYLKHNKDNFH